MDHHASFHCSSPSPGLCSHENLRGQVKPVGLSLCPWRTLVTVDGEWHPYNPLNLAFPDIDLSSVQMPSIFRLTATEAILRVDNLYYRRTRRSL